MTRSTRVLWFISLICIGLVGQVSQPPNAKALFLHPLKITQVTAVVEEDGPTTLTITGQNFSYRNFLKVNLGEVGELTIDGVPTDTQIVATWPSAIDAGDYLLTVKKGVLPHKRDTYDLTIGAVGPQGEQGEQGLQGEPGPAGQNGVGCSISEAIVTCGDTSANVQGPQGEPGLPGSSAPFPPIYQPPTTQIPPTSNPNPNPAIRTFKDGTAECEVGDKVLSGGFTLVAQGATGDAILSNLTVTTSQPNQVGGGKEAWSVRARQITENSDSWGVNVFVRCLDLTPTVP